MSRTKIRIADDKRMIIDMPEQVLVLYRKLMRKQGMTELKPFLENVLICYIVQQQDDGII